MKILFLVGDSDEKSPDRQLADVARSLIGGDAEVVLWDGSPLSSYGEPDGVWIFTQDEYDGCPEPIMSFLEQNFPALEDVPIVASGVGGKDGGMNAVTEICEFIESNDGRLLPDSEPLCIPLRSNKLDLEHDEKLELFFLVDSFLRYCGLDDSESRKIGLAAAVNDYFKILKFLSPERPSSVLLREDALVVGDRELDLSEPDELPEEIRDLCGEIGTLEEDYELEPEEILPALLKKVESEW